MKYKRSAQESESERTCTDKLKAHEEEKQQRNETKCYSDAFEFEKKTG